MLSDIHSLYQSSEEVKNIPDILEKIKPSAEDIRNISTEVKNTEALLLKIFAKKAITTAKAIIGNIVTMYETSIRIKPDRLKETGLNNTPTNDERIMTVMRLKNIRTAIAVSLDRYILNLETGLVTESFIVLCENSFVKASIMRRMIRRGIRV